MRICSHRPQRAVLEEGSHAGARNRRALTLTHQFYMHIGYEWKSKRKYIALFPHAAIGSLHQGKLSNLINVTESLLIESLLLLLQIFTSNLIFSFRASSFCQNETEYCAKTCRHFSQQERYFHRHKMCLKTDW